jgi:Uma2 family endonuclease
MAVAVAPEVHVPTVPAEPESDVWYEVVDGEHLEKPMSWESQWIGMRLARLIDQFLDEEDVGGWVNTEAYIACFEWAPGMKRRPDVAYWRQDQLPEPPMGGGDVAVAPAWCVEIVSPGNSAEELDRKTAEYFRAGVSFVWIIYPETKTVHTLEADGNAHWYRDDETIKDASVLPGFQLEVRRLFPR